MSNMNVELYEALKKAKVPENESRAAAIAVLEENRLLRDEIVSIKCDMDAKMSVVYWAAGLVILFVFLSLLGPELRTWLWPSEPSF